MPSIKLSTCRDRVISAGPGRWKILQQCLAACKAGMPCLGTGGETMIASRISDSDNLCGVGLATWQNMVDKKRQTRLGKQLSRKLMHVTSSGMHQAYACHLENVCQQHSPRDCSTYSTPPSLSNVHTREKSSDNL